jgi:hypothetical protein
MNGSSRYPHSAPAQHSYGESVPKRSPLAIGTANPSPGRAFHRPQNDARKALTCTNSVYWVCVGSPIDSHSTEKCWS